MNRGKTTVGDRIAQYRKKRGLSQKELASLSGLKQPTISSLERNEAKDSKKIASIAKALVVSAFWLETGEGEPEMDAQPVFVVDNDGLFVVKDPEGTVLLYTVATNVDSARTEFVRTHRLVWGQAQKEGYTMAEYGRLAR